jgi:hypothetical protein
MIRPREESRANSLSAALVLFSFSLRELGKHGDCPPAFRQLSGHHPQMPSNVTSGVCVTARATLDPVRVPSALFEIAPNRVSYVSLKATSWPLGGSVVLRLTTLAGATWTSQPITADALVDLPPRTTLCEVTAVGVSLVVVVEQSVETEEPNRRSRAKLAPSPSIPGRWRAPPRVAARRP